MMKFCVVRGPGADQSMVDHAVSEIKDRGIEAIEFPRDVPSDTVNGLLKETDLILTLGGDGTFLAGAKLAAPRGIPILGVNLGRLGFLTELDADQLESGLPRFIDGLYRIEDRTKLQVTLLRGGRSLARAIGLNEGVVH